VPGHEGADAVVARATAAREAVGGDVRRRVFAAFACPQTVMRYNARCRHLRILWARVESGVRSHVSLVTRP
jgi:hypothetical protein